MPLFLGCVPMPRLAGTIYHPRIPRGRHEIRPLLPGHPQGIAPTTKIQPVFLHNPDIADLARVLKGLPNPYELSRLGQVLHHLNWNDLARTHRPRWQHH